MKDDMKIEMEAGRNIQLDHIKEMLAKNDMLRQNEEMVKMITKLREQNTCLQSELDKVIHQLKDYEKALKIYAESDNWDLKTLQIDEVKYGWKPALKTLKKWEVK